jgi:hypothetical protein
MEATIQYIHVYADGLIEMVVMCNNCKHTNYHTITHSSVKKGDKTTIDFSKLGKRCCDNQEKLNKTKSACRADYKLYM